MNNSRSCRVLSTQPNSDSDLVIILHLSKALGCWHLFLLIFQNEHGKIYTSYLTERMRFSIFQTNLHKIEEHNTKYNNGEESYYLGINKFSDLTDEEFAKMYLSSREPKHTNGRYGHPVTGEPPNTIDWRQRGAVLAVKDQKNCAAGYAFSAVS